MIWLLEENSSSCKRCLVADTVALSCVWFTENRITPASLPLTVCLLLLGVVVTLKRGHLTSPLGCEWASSCPCVNDPQLSFVRVNSNPNLFWHLVCLWSPCIEAPFIFCICVAFKEGQCNVVVSSNIQHLTKSYGFPSVPQMLGIGKQDVCNNRKRNPVVLPDVVRSLTQASHLAFLWFWAWGLDHQVLCCLSHQLIQNQHWEWPEHITGKSECSSTHSMILPV